MWKQLLPSAVLLGVAATAIQFSIVVRDIRATQTAAQAREAQRLDRAASVSRWQAEALTQAETDRDAARGQVADLSTQLEAVKADRDKLKDQVAALQAVSYGLGSGAHVGLGFRPVSFPYGYCTWYVASRRLVTWSGNAIDWWWNAQGIRPEGYQPQVGAIQVSRDSGWGHVAFVEQVNGDGSWVVSEMNYVAWGYVDRRTVRPGGTLLGFIY